MPSIRRPRVGLQEREREKESNLATSTGGGEKGRPSRLEPRYLTRKPWPSLQQLSATSSSPADFPTSAGCPQVPTRAWANIVYARYRTFPLHWLDVAFPAAIVNVLGSLVDFETWRSAAKRPPPRGVSTGDSCLGNYWRRLFLLSRFWRNCMVVKEPRDHRKTLLSWQGFLAEKNNYEIGNYSPWRI